MAVRIAPEQIPGFPEALRACEQRLGSRGRILVRPSGTEPVIRVMTEGEDEAEIAAIAHELCDVIRRADRIGAHRAPRTQKRPSPGWGTAFFCGAAN